MLYDPNGRLLPDLTTSMPHYGQWVIAEPGDRAESAVSKGLTPERVAAIMAMADAGDPADQCRLAVEIDEKNPAISHAIETRRNAVLGLPWSLTPGDESPEAAAACEALTKALKNTADGYDSFDDLRSDLVGALLPGFAVSEIIWQPGGALGGFQSIPAQRFRFTSGRDPRLDVTGSVDGIALAPGKFIVHKTRRHGSDPVRGGLIRPLAWMHCFYNLNFKDLLAFVERYGMPFVVAKVDKDTYDNERNKIIRMIRQLGSAGGGLFNRSTDLEMLSASNVDGNVYFRLVEYVEAVIEKTVLGQTASSGESSGLSGGDAQSQVRQDILEADAARLDATLNTQLMRWWTDFNFGPGIAAPILRHDTGTQVDKTAAATWVASLAQAGYEVEIPALEKIFGVKISKREMPQATPAGMGGMFGGGFAMGTETSDTDVSAETLNLKQEYDAMGVAIRAGVLTATPEIEEKVRSQLGLPPLSDAVKKSWEATGGIRQPITLKATEAAAVDQALDVDGKPPASDGGFPMGGETTAPEPKAQPAQPAASAGDRWAKSVASAVETVLDTGDEEFAQALQALTDGGLLAAADTESLATEIERTTAAALAAGAVAEDARLAKKG